jgi:hypothetical protein
MFPTRQACFITDSIGAGFTLAVRSPPRRLPEILMQYTSKCHNVQLSFSFGPSPFYFWPHRPRYSGYYGLC